MLNIEDKEIFQNFSFSNQNNEFIDEDEEYASLLGYARSRLFNRVII